jgi:uncharacterized membrane protein YgcG
MKRKIGIVLLALLGIFSAFAARAVTISVGVPVTQSLPSGAAGPGATIFNFYNFALFISGILAFGAIVWGGIKYALAAGNPSGQSEGKQWIQGALIGLLLLAGAYIILKTINPALISLDIPQLSQLPQPTTSGSSGSGVAPTASGTNPFGNGGSSGGGGASGAW